LDHSAELTPTIRILRLAQVMQITGLHKTVIYALQATGEFPMRVHLTPRSVGWVEEEVKLWLEQRIAVRRPQRLGLLRSNTQGKRDLPSR
jgi:prophage regulatory protein